MIECILLILAFCFVTFILMVLYDIIEAQDREIKEIFRQLDSLGERVVRLMEVVNRESDRDDKDA